LSRSGSRKRLPLWTREPTPDAAGHALGPVPAVVTAGCRGGKIRTLAALGIAAMACACAEGPVTNRTSWASTTGAQEDQFYRDRAACLSQADLGQAGISVHNFNRCMQERGWVLKAAERQRGYGR
jgi:hypothetical protein